MNPRTVIIVVIVAALLLLANNSIYLVHATERAIVLRFGAVIQSDVQPGIHFKLPVAEEVKKFDGRVLTLDTGAETYYTLEKKPLIVDSFVKWRIINVQAYYKASSGDERRAEQILGEQLNEGLRNQISRRDMHEVVSGERDQLMQELTSNLNRRMQENIGVEVIDVRVKRIDLPAEVSNAVYDRMNSERQIEARQHRAQGRELALGVRADAERQTTIIRAQAYSKAEQIRGDGDATSARTYADAFNKDPDFYEFYRSINAYTQVFRDKNDLLVIDPKSEFFKYLKKDS